MSERWQSLTRQEAERRKSLLRATAYDVHLDLTTGEETFASTTVVRYEGAAAGDTFLDVKPADLVSVMLDGQPVDVARLDRGRLPLEVSPGAHELVVTATMGYRNDGEGLHRSVDPADGRAYVYGMSFMDAAPSVFACFDQPDLKAPYTFTVTAPSDWLVVGNAPARPAGSDGGTARWELGPTPPLATYFVTVVAGPYHLLASEHDGIRLSLSSRQSLAATLDREADELFTLTRQSLDELHRLFGTRYAFGDYHQAFVPEFNAGAMENPGCVTIRDPLLFDRASTRAERSFRAALVAHEMAHQWFGNLVTPRWWDDLWLNESFAEYVGYRVTADATQYDDAWVDQSYARRVWGLTADSRPTTHPVAGNDASDAVTALQSFDGISYARGSNVLRQLAARLGDDVFLGGVRDLFDRHRFGNITMHDAFDAWATAGATDLEAFTRDWLLTPGPDTLVLDRDAGAVRRTPPPDAPADRRHLLDVARHDGERWTVTPLELAGPTTPYDAGSAPVLLDARETTWAVSPPDELTLAALPRLAPDIADPQLRATMWNSLRLGVFDGVVTPAALAEVLVAAPPVEDTSSGVRNLLVWVLDVALPLCPPGTTERFHSTVVERTAAEAPGSELQLSAFRYAVGSATDDDVLAAWERPGGMPDGVVADEDLTWRVRIRRAELGAVDRTHLDAALADRPSGSARVAHARAVSSLPTSEAKEFAWDRLLGRVDVANYELEAAGLGMWRPDQTDLTAPYVPAFFAALPDIVATHQGWVQGVAVEAFFPITHVEQATVTAARAALDGELPGAVRRRLLDSLDDLERLVGVAR